MRELPVPDFLTCRVFWRRIRWRPAVSGWCHRAGHRSEPARRSSAAWCPAGAARWQTPLPAGSRRCDLQARAPPVSIGRGVIVLWRSRRRWYLHAGVMTFYSSCDVLKKSKRQMASRRYMITAIYYMLICVNTKGERKWRKLQRILAWPPSHWHIIPLCKAM